MSRPVRARAPLRLGLAGGGTDVSPYCDRFGGMVLNATINRYAHCILSAREDELVVFDAPDMGVTVEFADGRPVEAEGPCMLQIAVYRRMIEQFNRGQRIPLTVTTFLDAPPRSGLGSSSTMVVSLVAAFAELLAAPLSDYDVARIAYEIERVDLGLTGGKQDQYASAFGGVNLMEFYDGGRVIVNPLRIKDWILRELEASIVLYHTGISRESAKIIEQQIENTERDGSDALEAAHRLKQDVPQMKEAILLGEVERFATILDRSWQSKKRMAAGIASAPVNEVDARAREAGAVAGKISGAGGGGYMMFVVPPRQRVGLVDTLNALGPGKVLDFQFVKVGATVWRPHGGCLA